MKYLLPFILIISGCSQKFETDERELMKIHNEQRTAHFEKNAAVIVNQASDQFISVNRGRIDSLFSREEDRQRFQQYFNAVSFIKWDDVSQPLIRFSEDHSLAYMIVDKLVVLQTTDSTGQKIEESTRFAWVTILRKDKSGKWKTECIASTEQRPETEVIR